MYRKVDEDDKLYSNIGRHDNESYTYYERRTQSTFTVLFMFGYSIKLASSALASMCDSESILREQFKLAV